MNFIKKFGNWILDVFYTFERALAIACVVLVFVQVAYGIAIWKIPGVRNHFISEVQWWLMSQSAQTATDDAPASKDPVVIDKPAVLDTGSSPLATPTPIPAPVPAAAAPVPTPPPAKQTVDTVMPPVTTPAKVVVKATKVAKPIYRKPAEFVRDRPGPRKTDTKVFARKPVPADPDKKVVSKKVGNTTYAETVTGTPNSIELPNSLPTVPDGTTYGVNVKTPQGYLNLKAQGPKPPKDETVGGIAILMLIVASAAIVAVTRPREV